MDALAGYGSSDSFSDYENTDESKIKEEIESEGVVRESTRHKAVNFLTETVENNSSDDDQGISTDNDEYKKACEFLQTKLNAPPQLPNPLSEKLPAPNLDKKVQSTFNTKEKQSVFVTSYKKDEEAKLSILEKHVKVTALPTGSKINGKQVCWLYRKGQCKKGHRCKFAHDNDLFVQNDSSTGSESHTDSSTSGKQSNRNFRFGVGYFQSQHMSKDPVDEDSYMSNMKRKPKPGVNDHLRPPKKSMTMLDKQRAAERPWTVQK